MLNSAATFGQTVLFCHVVVGFFLSFLARAMNRYLSSFRGFGGLPPRSLITGLETTSEEMISLVKSYDDMPNGTKFIDQVPSSALRKESFVEKGFARAKHRARNYNSLTMEVYGRNVSRLSIK